MCVNPLSSDMVLSLPRLSVCELEVDALAADILNRHELSLGELRMCSTYNNNNSYDYSNCSYAQI